MSVSIQPHCVVFKRIVVVLSGALVVGAIVEYMGTDPDSKNSTGEVILVQNVGWPKDWYVRSCCD
jgi:hypothetical protein